MLNAIATDDLPIAPKNTALKNTKLKRKTPNKELKRPEKSQSLRTQLYYAIPRATLVHGAECISGSRRISNRSTLHLTPHRWTPHHFSAPYFLAKKFYDFFAPDRTERRFTWRNRTERRDTVLGQMN